jgi:hypothetical protein
MSTKFDAVTREQVEAWAKLAGIEHFTEQGLARLGDFAIFARQDRVQPDSVRMDGTVTLTGAQLLEAFEFVAPDHPNDADQLECEVTIQNGDGHDGPGLYCWITEYPEEGAIRLDAATASSAGDQS